VLYPSTFIDARPLFGRVHRRSLVPVGTFPLSTFKIKGQVRKGDARRPNGRSAGTRSRSKPIPRGDGIGVLSRGRNRNGGVDDKTPNNERPSTRGGVGIRRKPSNHSRADSRPRFAARKYPLESCRDENRIDTIRSIPQESCRGIQGVLSRDSRFSTGVLSHKLIGDLVTLQIV